MQSVAQTIDQSMIMALFGNVIARNATDLKAIGTTIANGVDLLNTGYVFGTHHQAPNAYYCGGSKAGEVYNLQITAREVTCDCPQSTSRGVCKHAVALIAYRPVIDAAIAEQEARDREQEAALAAAEAAAAEAAALAAMERRRVQAWAPEDEDHNWDDFFSDWNGR